MGNPQDTQQTFQTTYPCPQHETRIGELERRMDNAESMHEILTKLAAKVEVVDDRVGMLMRLAWLVTGAIITSLVGGFFFLLTGIQ